MSIASEEAFQKALIGEMGHVRAFARSLCAGRTDVADDIAQETLVKAWSARTRFDEKSNLRAWLFAIVRNTFLDQRRKAWRETLLDNFEGIGGATSARESSDRVELDDARRALGVLPEDQREALVLVAVAGFSYDEAAEICETKVGTIKSRVARARARLEEAYTKGEIGSAGSQGDALDALIEEAHARAGGR
jgi:RNA polymerase sigma-70 factor (ECF subfamily)